MENRHYIAVTGIIVKDGKYLITKRPSTKKAFPNKWTVPGGNLEVEDYLNLPKDTGDHWYNVFEKVLRREIKEEVGLEIGNIKYLTSMTFLKGEDPVLIVSMYSDYSSGEVVLNEESVDFAWVSLEETRNYDLIEGIYEEFVMLDKMLNGQEAGEWGR
ncbi:NUDIX domain-containing protein [Candidatus Pacearchaeota archaeon]|nr:NUDIX domain-containing protein [Candidatus Pacearchaeota archaeon]